MNKKELTEKVKYTLVGSVLAIDEALKYLEKNFSAVIKEEKK